MTDASPVGLLLAAGRGTRFDASGARDKLLASLPDGTPVAVVSARRLLAATGRVVALVRPGADALTTQLQRAGCEVLVCAHAARGMGRVLACGVAHTRDAHGWIVALADMPFIAESTLAAIVKAVRSHDRVAPFFRGERGHPVGFGAALRDTLSALDGDRGARDALAAPGLARIDVDDPGVLRDIDTPADLASALPSRLV